MKTNCAYLKLIGLFYVSLTGVFPIHRANAQTFDYGDLPDPGYPTKLASNGARHTATAYLYLGDNPADQENDAHASSDALGDDQNGTDDEDGINPAGLIFTPGATTGMQVKVNNWMTMGSARLYAFVDWNHDGDFADTDEAVSVAVPAASFGVLLTVPLHVPSTAVTTSPTALRLRLSTDQNLGPTGLANNGEVEDYLVPVHADLDFGDLPAPYPTLAADDGARHVIVQHHYMGLNGPDPESDGQPDAYGLGDDSNSIDDEDGFDPASVHPVPGSPVVFPVIVTTPSISGSTLYGFTDWNNDGDFDDVGERSSMAVPANASGLLVNLPWNVPATAATGVMLAVRLRLTSNLNVGPVGLCTDGEVEDYHIVIASGALDFGDLPDAVEGTLPGVVVHSSTVSQGDYRTRLADNGPRHGIRPDLFIDSPMQALPIDAENDGQPGVLANGDDANGADEGRVAFTTAVTNMINVTPVSADVAVEVNVTIPFFNATGSPAEIACFLDQDNDGDLGNIATGLWGRLTYPSQSALQTGVFNFTYFVHLTRPQTDFHMKLPLRVRLSTQPDLGPDGPAIDGEVEDYIVDVPITLDPWWPDTPLDFGDLYDSYYWNGYHTTLGNGGACHVIVPGMFLGDLPPDADGDGQPTLHADGDDINGADDEDGFVPAAFHPVAGQLTNMMVKVTTPVTTGATLYGFVDWNYDGDFDDPGERSSIEVGAGVSGAIVALPWNVPADAIMDTMLNVRLRLSSDVGLGVGGLASDGEVEDYRVVIESGGWDFGDLPDAVEGSAPGVVSNLNTVSQGDYHTRLADNGARHKIRPDLLFQEGPFFVPIDAEADANPLGDSASGPDTEVPIFSSVMKQVADNITEDAIDLHLTIQFSTCALNETGQTAYLTGFADWNNDGDFDDPDERMTLVVPSKPSPPVPDFPGVVYEPVFHPSWHVPRPITGFTVKAPVRFRLSTQPDLGPDGPAPDGEVQDIIIQFSFICDPWWSDANAGFDAFMLAHGLLGASSLPEADPDQDNRSNFEEYAFGGNPGQADAALAFQPRVVDISGQRYGLAAYLRLPGGTSGPGGEYQTANVLYHPIGTVDLSIWDQSLLHATPPGNLPAAPAGYEWGAVRFTVPVETAPRGFFRWLIGTP